MVAFKFDIPEELSKYITERKNNALKYKWYGDKYKPLVIVKLVCLNDKGSKLLKKGTFCYGWADSGNTGWVAGYKDFPVYKIIHPVLGPRKYDPKRFAIIDKFQY